MLQVCELLRCREFFMEGLDDLNMLLHLNVSSVSLRLKAHVISHIHKSQTLSADDGSS